MTETPETQPTPAAPPNPKPTTDLAFSDAQRWVLSCLAAAVRPKKRLPIAQWAEANIVLSADTNSPRIGPLDLSDVAFVKPILARLDPADPCRGVNVLAAAQSAKSLIGQIWSMYSIAENPGPLGVYLPSIDDARKYAEEKIQAVIDGSPTLKHRVRAVSSRSGAGSSTLRKRFVGGSMRIATASSPNALQMVSFRDLILEEVAGYDADVGGRGSPIDQAKKRQRAWLKRGAKWLQLSAGGVAGKCPSSDAHEKGAAYELYLPCPHCSGFGRYEIEDMRGPSETTGPHFACRLCGGIVEDHHKGPMVAASVYIATYEDGDDANPAPPAAFEAGELERWQSRPELGRAPSYRWWVYVSPFVGWDDVWTEWIEAKAGGLAQEKTFCQQTLARKWDEGRDAPDHVKLFELREDYDEGVVPAGAYVLTGMADVQNDHLTWSVIGWGPGAEWWLIDRDKILGDPAGSKVWDDLAEVLKRRYPHAEGGEVGIELFGVDTGYKSHNVYLFCGNHPTARALDGLPGWNRPYIGKPKRVKARLDGKIVGSTLLYPTGTWSLKSELAYSLRLAIDKGVDMPAPGRAHFPRWVTQDFVRELVAEHVVEESSRGRALTHVWKLRKGFRNEATDEWVGARSLAYGLGIGAPKSERQFDWDAARTLICGGPLPAAAAERSAPPPPPAPPPAAERPKGGTLLKQKPSGGGFF
jgi:phage terminase large subunit GpA-like protein